jgi:uncharacterized membrane protein YebE (DUF533 family)
MDTKKHLEKMKDFFEDGKGQNKEALTELGSAALLVLSGFVANKMVRNLLMIGIVIAAGKLAYDYLQEEDTDTEKA